MFLRYFGYFPDCSCLFYVIVNAVQCKMWLAACLGLTTFSNIAKRLIHISLLASQAVGPTIYCFDFYFLLLFVESGNNVPDGREL
jgi:hypothetical protein